MGKVIKVLGLVWAVAKRFDLDELKDIWAEVQDVMAKIKEAKAAPKKDRIKLIAECGEELYDVYEKSLDAYNN